MPELTLFPHSETMSLQRWDRVGECVGALVGGGRESVDIWPGVQMYSLA